jgi:hypothetical protein
MKIWIVVVANSRIFCRHVPMSEVSVHEILSFPRKNKRLEKRREQVGSADKDA